MFSPIPTDHTPSSSIRPQSVSPQRERPRWVLPLRDVHWYVIPSHARVPLTDPSPRQSLARILSRPPHSTTDAHQVSCATSWCFSTSSTPILPASSRTRWVRASRLASGGPRASRSSSGARPAQPPLTPHPLPAQDRPSASPLQQRQLQGQGPLRERRQQRGQRCLSGGPPWQLLLRRALCCSARGSTTVSSIRDSQPPVCCSSLLSAMTPLPSPLSLPTHTAQAGRWLLAVFLPSLGVYLYYTFVAMMHRGW